MMMITNNNLLCMPIILHNIFKYLDWFTQLKSSWKRPHFSHSRYNNMGYGSSWIAVSAVKKRSETES